MQSRYGIHDDDFTPSYVPAYPPVAYTPNSPEFDKDDWTLSHKSNSAMIPPGSVPRVDGGLRRQLKARHISMISIGGVIGTGLFLGSAHALQYGGPAGLLLGYAFMGSITYAMMISLGEMIAHLPIAGGHITLAQRFVNPALSFALGWNYWYNWTIALPAELNAAAVLIGYWNNRISPAVFIAVCFIAVIAINVGGTRVYGEAEFWFASIKVVTILGLIILGIVIDAGGGPTGEVVGVRNWSTPFVQYLGVEGPLGRFLGFWAVCVQAAFSYSGTEIVAMAAGEAKNPKVSLPKAIRRVYARILLFYILGTFIIGLLVAASDTRLSRSDGTALSSPFVIAIQDSGIKILPSVINGAILTSAWSAASSNLYTSSRTLYGLALTHNAPRCFTRVNSYGLPYLAVSVSIAFGLVSFMSAGTASAATVFTWFVSMTSSCVLLSWGGVCFTYLRFYHGARAQGISRDLFPYKAPFQPYAAYWALIFCILIAVTQGWKVFLKGQWNTATFVTTYLPVILFPIVYFAASIWKGTGLVPLLEMDFFSGSRDIDEEPELPPRHMAEKIMRALL